MDLYAAFKTEPEGSRASGMAQAYCAVSDDVYAVMFNPSGLGQINENQISYTYSRPYLGLDLGEITLNNHFCGLVYPVKAWGSFGLSWKNFQVTEVYQQNIFILSYGSLLNQLLFDLLKPSIYSGVNIKYLYHQYSLDSRTKDDPLFHESTGRGNIAIDIGFLFHDFISSLPNLGLGLTIQNINQPDLGLKEYDPVYQEYCLGLSYILPNFILSKVKTQFYLEKERSMDTILLALDLKYRNNEFLFQTGIEFNFWKRLLRIRMGYNTTQLSLGMGSSFILNKHQFLFDYSLSLPHNIEQSYGTHSGTLSFYF